MDRLACGASKFKIPSTVEREAMFLKMIAVNKKKSHQCLYGNVQFFIRPKGKSRIYILKMLLKGIKIHIKTTRRHYFIYEM